MILGGGATTLLFLKKEPEPELHSSSASEFRNEPKAGEEVNQNPIKLEVPTLQIEATIIPVGLTPEGDMEAPSNVEQVAWYKLGPKPGEMGSAVLAGHLDGENGEKGVFYNLNELKKGDEISVQMQEGEKQRFTVKGSKIFNSEDDASEVFLPADGKYLNLITCNGEWDKEKENYEERLVVFAELTK